jgi:hypothetical protein
MIDWNLIQNLEQEAILLSVFPDATPLGECFYQIGSEAYVATWHISNSKTGTGPFIVKAAWAPSAGAARRALFNEPLADDGAFGTPPDALLLKPGCRSYTAIEQLAVTGQFGKFRIPSVSDHPVCRYRIAVGDRIDYHFRIPMSPSMPLASTIGISDGGCVGKSPKRSTEEPRAWASPLYGCIFSPESLGELMR